MRLPLFDNLPNGAVERLSAGRFGRGLLTPSLRTRLRKAGFADMGALALATPTDLTAVRKIGPARVGAIRTHILDEIARLYPDARAAHGEAATSRRRMERLRALPVERLGLDAAVIEQLSNVEGAPAPSLLGAGLDEVVATLTQLLILDQPLTRLIAATREVDDAQEERATRQRAEILRERDREWDEADPARNARLTDRSRAKSDQGTRRA